MCEVMQLLYFDIMLLVGVLFVQLLLVGYNVFVYVFCGSVLVGDVEVFGNVGLQCVEDKQMVIFVNMEGVEGVVICVGDVEVCVLLVVGKLLNELIV